MKMISSDVKKLVAGATFTIQTKERGKGQCVLVEGGLIITAAHCLEWDCTGKMAMGDLYWNKIKTASGDLIASTVAVEPVSDIAVLGSPDPQLLPENKAFAFEEWCERIAPIKLLRKTPKAREPFPVWIRTHFKTWVAGMGTFYGGGATFAYKTGSEIQSGTSGGPIVNHAGELVGVVSHGTNNCIQGKYDSAAALLSLALPAWINARAA